MNKIVVISLEDLKAVIEEVVNSKQHEKKEKENVTMMDVIAVSKFLKISLSSIYRLTSKRIIPHFKRGRKIYFNQLDIIAWIGEGKRESISNSMRKFSS